MVRFVIFGQPRSGSNYLCSLLDSHPQIICHLEVFHTDKIYYSFKKKLPFTMDERDRDPGEFINNIFENNFEKQAVGFKIFKDHSEKAQKILLNDRNIKKILLSRKNIIQTYVSNLIAWKTSCFFEEKGSLEQHQIKVDVDTKKLFEYDKKYSEYYSNLKQVLGVTNQEFLEIYFENLFDTATIDSVFRFLRVEKGEHLLECKTRKQNPAALKDKVNNIEILKQELRGTHLEKFLE